MFVDDTDRQRIYDTKKKTEFNGPRTNAMTSFDRYSSHLMIARQYFIFLHVESALKLLLPTYSITWSSINTFFVYLCVSIYEKIYEILIGEELPALHSYYKHLKWFDMQ